MVCTWWRVDAVNLVESRMVAHGSRDGVHLVE